jgi:flavocytochrome c
MTITYALMEKYDEICKTHPHRARSVTKAQVTKLLKDNEGRVIGVEYIREGVAGQEYGPVILATGGYAADFSETSLLKKYRPDIYDLPTTNGDYSTGDGIKMGLEIGANAIDLEKVQVHPTGLVDPKEPDAKVKFLAAEALRGVGGLLLDANGNRFCDELGHRDYVTGKMWENKGPFRLILNKAAAQTIEWHCKHYMGRGLMRKFNHGKDIASDMGISTDKLQSTFKAYNEVAKSGKCPFGKKYFDAVPFDVSDEFYVAIVTPVLHFCMGGLEINAESEVLGAGLKPVPGLFAGGEVAGGVHGANRLGGSSLLGCVVYGRVSGDSAARYLLGNLATGNAGLRRAGAVAAQVGDFSIGATVSPASNKVTLELSWNEKGAVVAAPAAAPVAAVAAAASAPAPAPAAPTKKEYTLEEIAKHNKETDCWVIVNGEVLDVTAFLKDHPGGKKAILLFAGRDASEEFNMLHKPDVIAKYSPESVIGTVKGGAAHPKAKL